MAGAHIDLELEQFEPVLARLNQLASRGNDLSPIFTEIGEYLQLSHRDHFDKQQSPDGQPWEQLSNTTKALKPKHSDVILRLNDILRDTLSYQVNSEGLEFGSNQVYAAMHQFGGKTSPKSMIPNRTIPARPFLGIGSEGKTVILEMLGDFLSEAL